MTRKQIALAVCCALSASLLAACNKPAPDANRGASQAQQPSPTTPSTPANIGQPSSAEKKEGGNPVQGQVDPKEPAQRKDFQQRGDQSGPTSEETKPRGGGG
jgi:hypothetical protein